MRSNNNSFALFIKLRPACSTEDLQHIQDADVDKRAFFSIVYLCTLKLQKNIWGHFKRDYWRVKSYPASRGFSLAWLFAFTKSFAKSFRRVRGPAVTQAIFFKKKFRIHTLLYKKLINWVQLSKAFQSNDAVTISRRQAAKQKKKNSNNNNNNNYRTKERTNERTHFNLVPARTLSSCCGPFRHMRWSTSNFSLQ